MKLVKQNNLTEFVFKKFICICKLFVYKCIITGFDKNAELIPCWDSKLVSIGFVEVGSVTGKASDGNPKPRCFRVPLDRAVINRMGLNNAGAGAISQTLAKEGPKRRSVVLGVNLAKTHDPNIVGDGALKDFEVRI